jgi:probable F420-dependent oxidoreductase
MPKIELGSFGAVLSPDADSVPQAAAELERLGYSTIWLTGGPLQDLQQIADVVRATRTARIGSSIISVDRFEAPAVAELYTELQASAPGRFVVGIGGAHGPNPLGTLSAYLGALSAVPVSARVMAALGPRMLEFARSNAAGVLPVLVTPEYTRQARAVLGEQMTLAVSQLVVLEEDPPRARATARGPLGFLGTVPAYQNNFRRMGFSDDEITELDDRLVDALVGWGSPKSIVEGIRAHQRSGADHVALSVITDSPDASPLKQYQTLAETLGLATPGTAP